jgi:hypothetical protein
MSEKKYAVPEGMLNAVQNALVGYWRDHSVTSESSITVVLESALSWLAENPVTPTNQQLFEISGSLPVKMAQIVWSERDRALLAEWQRRMFLASEPEIDPKKCPHRWQAKNDDTTEERVVYCELCDWVYSRDSLTYRRGKEEQ